MIMELGILMSLVATEPAAQVRAEWWFGGLDGWAGWVPNGEIRDESEAATFMAFATRGTDPQLLSPMLDAVPANNNQWIEIEIASEGAGVGEVFYTNKTTGQYGGLEPEWRVPVIIPGGARQVVRAWPFWGSIGSIVRLRFDPPDGLRLRLYAIRIVEAAAVASHPEWALDSGTTGWQPMVACAVEPGSGETRFVARAPQAMILAPVVPFDAATRPVLRVAGECPGEELLGVYWVSLEHPGLHGEPVAWEDLAGEQPVDLRRFPTWSGTITHLGLSFGSAGGEVLSLRRLALQPADPSRALLRVRYLGFARAINRSGGPAILRVLLEHAAGPPLAATTAHLAAVNGSFTVPAAIRLPALAPGATAEVTCAVVLHAPGPARLRLTCNGQVFTRDLRVDEPVSPPPLGDYPVPPPRPVQSHYQIGVYYFPGWSPDQHSRWQLQEPFPDRDPLLGWYAEGNPEVADWHIKWAVENGISFFVFDWYWRDGKEDLRAGLNDGFLQARYCNQMQFALMWANHKPFAEHTPEQLIEVTQYWIEHYLRRDNYLRVDGLPYVSFFAPGELLSCLGGETQVREAFEAMRRTARTAGLPGLHIAACGGTNPDVSRLFKQMGFDSFTAYNYVVAGAAAKQSLYAPYMLAHRDIWWRMEQGAVLPYVPLLTINWDPVPWHGPRTQRYFGRNPADFAFGLGLLKGFLDDTGRRMALLEAWNEWGEGSFLEPNAAYGFADLEAVRRTFAKPGNWPQNLTPDDFGLHGRYDLRAAK